jgi:KDO2-lipid IV(A) lauroyltransferase
MKKIKYFFEFIIIGIFFLIFKFLGLKISSFFGGILGNIFGPLFRSKKLIQSNILKALPDSNEIQIKNIIHKMWNNYGRILSEYMFIKKFREKKFHKNIIIEGQDILEKIKYEKKPVIFISGHFNNFELMAMQIEMSGIDLATIYRPLNNIFINVIMEKIRKKYICKKQIKKGMQGMRELLSMFKNGTSVALMIDQRVSEGIKSNFFGTKAYTTTIPAQFVKKFNCKIVPIYIERVLGINFKINVEKPIEYQKDDSLEKITQDLNLRLEKMILKNPSQWIWSHNRWK